MKTDRLGFLLSVAVVFTMVFGLPLAASATCTPSKISLSPVSLNAITGSVDSVTTTTTIADDCGAPLTYTATVTGGSSWLTLPVSGKDSMTVTANIKGMAAGTYTGKATIKATGLTDAGLTVTLTIGTTCAATLDNTLKLKAPIIKYTDSASTKHYYWVDEVYTSDPSKVLFKVSALGAQGTTGYNCNMSWIDSDLIIYARDVLFGGSFYWLKLAYDTSLSDSSNYYFYAKNYGAGSMSGVDSNLYFGFSYGTTNTTNSVSSSTGSMPNGKTVSGTLSFEVLLTNGAASEAVGALGYLNSDYSFSSITSGIFTKTTTDGKKIFEKIEFGTDSLPASITDYSTGYTTTFSSYSNGTVHIKVVDSAGVVIVSDKQIDIEAEWFTYFSNQIAKSSSAEKTLEAIGYAMGTIFDKITCALAPETTAGNSACGGSIAAVTTFGCDLTKTKDGICGYINVVPDGLAGAATLASCVANVTNSGSSVVDCTKDITAKVIEKAKVTFVKEITPGSGIIGTAVTITGSGFGTTNGTVTFNGTTATITSWTDTEIKTTIPTGATTGYVVVTDADGVTSNGVLFTVITLNVYTVTPSAGTGGSINPNTPQTVAQGSTTAFTVTPDTGYSVSVSGTCGGTLSGSAYTTNAITANCTVEAHFTPCITLSPATMDFPLSGGNGTINITASGSGCSWTAATNETWITFTSASSGTGNGTVAYSVAPNTGASRVGTIMIGGQSLQGVTITQAGVSVCTNTAPAISVSGAPTTATVGTAVSATVTISDTDVGNNPTLTVNYGAVIGNTWSWTPATSGTYTVILTANDGQSCNNTTSTSFTVTVTAQTTYTVTPSAATGGSISPSTPQTVVQGATTTFTVTPNTGYSASVSGTCGGTLSGSAYTTNAITANCTVIASFTQSSSNYTDNGNGTVTDSATGLTWQKGENATTYTWYVASGTYDATYNASTQSICGSLNLAGGGWRLPTLTELHGLVDNSVYPSGTSGLHINTTYFPNAYAFSYWSSTPDAYGPGSAWYVHFSVGFSYYYGKYGYYYVRCVRP